MQKCNTGAKSHHSTRETTFPVLNWCKVALPYLSELDSCSACPVLPNYRTTEALEQVKNQEKPYFLRLPPSDAEVRKAAGRKGCGGIEVTTVKKNRRDKKLANAVEVGIAELIPFGGDK